MAKKIIVLDPGHGGRDSGAVGNGLFEKEINLYLAREVAIKLSSYDADVKFTRDDDTYLSLDARANFANNLKADFFLSIHVNAGGGTGFESFIYKGPINTSTASMRSIIHDHIVKFLIEYGVVNRGEKTANFAVLRETNMSAVLIENLFIDSAKDAALLKDIEFLTGLCDAITDGIVKSQNLKLIVPEPKPTPQPLPTPTPEPTPDDPPIWDPEKEIQKLKEAGYLANDHPTDAPVTWGEFATVLNRIIDSTKKQK